MRDGGPAFPAIIPNIHDSEQGKDFPHWEESGMSLRDYFAAKALSAILPVADSGIRRNGEEGIQAKAHDYARAAYSVADAMLEARKK